MEKENAKLIEQSRILLDSRMSICNMNIYTLVQVKSIYDTEISKLKKRLIEIGTPQPTDNIQIHINSVLTQNLLTAYISATEVLTNFFEEEYKQIKKVVSETFGV